MSEEKREATSYRGISIQIIDGRHYTLGKFYSSIEDAQAKIDRYWDYDEESDSVV